MADPLLTSLCSICHIATPKYKCPRCRLQTCSAACVKKHKAWSECSGERDATAYVPRSQLRTVAGVNHDYNFLHRMDLSVERAERVLVGDKGLVRHDELRPETVHQVRWKTGRDGRKKKVLVAARAPRGARQRRLDGFLAHRLRQLNIHVALLPHGMTRQRENKTTFDRRSGRINWQVEWLFWGGGGGDDDDDDDDGDKGCVTRCLSKVVEDVPLFQAYEAALDGRESAGRNRRPRSGWRDKAQRLSDAAWNADASPAQDPLTGRWLSYQGADLGSGWPGDADREAQQRRHRFFLRGPPTGSNAATAVVALEPTDCLRDALANAQLVEYPTLYVLKAGEALPAGFVIVPKDTTPAERGGKRKAPAPDGPGRPPAKRQKPDAGEDGPEEGEVGESGEDQGADEEDGSGEDRDAIEVDEEGAESWGDDGDGEDGSSTSSSGAEEV